MTERSTRPSNQIFAAADVDAALLARALGIPDDALPEEARKVFDQICSKHHREGRLHDMDRVAGTLLALREALKERGATRLAAERADARVDQIIVDELKRLKLAKDQAREQAAIPMRDPEDR